MSMNQIRRVRPRPAIPLLAHHSQVRRVPPRPAIQLLAHHAVRREAATVRASAHEDNFTPFSVKFLSDKKPNALYHNYTQFKILNLFVQL